LFGDEHQFSFSALGIGFMMHHGLSCPEKSLLEI